MKMTYFKIHLCLNFVSEDGISRPLKDKEIFLKTVRKWGMTTSYQSQGSSCIENCNKEAQDMLYSPSHCSSHRPTAQTTPFLPKISGKNDQVVCGNVRI